MFFLVMYDICDKKRLRKVENVISSYGVRVQKSVFECDISESKMKTMCNDVVLEMELSSDSIRIYPLLNDARNKVDILGVGLIPSFPASITV